MAIFAGGWVTGNAQAHSQLNAESWKALTTVGRILWVKGFHEGYSAGADTRELLARQDLTGPQRAEAEEIDRELRGRGENQHMTLNQISTAMSTFYGDYRNQAVCWSPALLCAVRALNGKPASEEELNRLRASYAKSGCE
jgi:hypothetical protein